MNDTNNSQKEIPKTISATGAKNMVEAGNASSIIDVRTAAEYSSEHIEGSVFITLDQVKNNLDQIRAVPEPRLLLCKGGVRAANAQKILEQAGITGTCVIEGGIMSYSDVGGVTVKGGKAVMSLERQVRIAAGLLIVIGVVLSLLVNKWFVLLSGFVGCGLVFAGLTDTCGMAMLLAKAPWNSRSVSCSNEPVKSCSNKPASFK